MTRFAPRGQDQSARDVGFTLIEVIWALVLLGIIAMASLGLFFHGMNSVAHVQRQQAAVSLANSAMDTARSVSGGPVNAAQTSGLVKGRSETAVKAAWSAAASADTSDMKIVWDTASGLGTGDQWVPITTTAKVDNQTYTITTLVGTCFRLRAASTTSQDCIPTVTDASVYNKMYRVRVIVTWDEGSTGTKAYSYRLSTLIDPSDDPTWNTELDPFAYDDEARVDAGSTQPIGIVANDTVEYNAEGSKSPIVMGTSPSYGTVTKGGTGSLGVVNFAAPTNGKSGTVTFTYYVKGLNEKQSAKPGTVTVHILPVPVTDKLYVTAGSTTELNVDVLKNDIGVENLSSTRSTTIVPVWDPSVDMFTTEEVTAAIQEARNTDAQNLADHGISMSGGKLIFKAPATKTDTSFYYYLVDDGSGSDVARYPSTTAVKVTVSTQDPPLTTPDLTIPSYNVPTVSSPWVETEILWKTLINNEYAKYIRIDGTPTGPGAAGAKYEDNVYLDGNKYTVPANQQGTTLKFRTNNTSMGTYVITYKLVSTTGSVSTTTGKITVTVNPVAADYDFGSLNRNTSSLDVDVANAPSPGIAPKTGVKVVNLQKVAGSTCTLPSTAPTGTSFKITGLSNGKSCQVNYQLQSTGLATPLTSTTKSIKVSVKN